jgi:hypothetical protein
MTCETSTFGKLAYRKIRGWSVIWAQLQAACTMRRTEVFSSHLHLQVGGWCLPVPFVSWYLLIRAENGEIFYEDTSAEAQAMIKHLKQVRNSLFQPRSQS